jgi:hypothetical protein
MGTICRIYEQNSGGGTKFVAQIRDGKVTGPKAGPIQKQLRRFGFPNAPLETVIDMLLLTEPGLTVAYAPGWPKKRRGGG